MSGDQQLHLTVEEKLGNKIRLMIDDAAWKCRAAQRKEKALPMACKSEPKTRSKRNKGPTGDASGKV
ncbi:MAG: hypothetical protein SGI71_04605 [Verrucomicrobiota bacterium]|nr:hypothetical protein [Verrucomicrobiota bacterium]